MFESGKNKPALVKCWQRFDTESSKGKQEEQTPQLRFQAPNHLVIVLFSPAPDHGETPAVLAHGTVLLSITAYAALCQQDQNWVEPSGEEAGNIQEFRPHSKRRLFPRDGHVTPGSLNRCEAIACTEA